MITKIQVGNNEYLQRRGIETMKKGSKETQNLIGDRGRKMIS